VAEGLPRLVIQGHDADTADMLRALQRVVLRHPIAAKAAFGSLRAEGRTFAQTPEGARWADALRHSPAVSQARLAFDATTLGALDGAADGLLPGAFVDALVQAGATDDLTGLLAGVFALGDDG
jgi:hypothetical protein